MNKELIIKKINSQPDKYGVWKNLQSKSKDELLNILLEENPQLAIEEKQSKTTKLKQQDGKVIISMSGIKKSFGNKEVHKGIDLDIYEGETLAILGSNGAGKTVLMETLVRVQKQDEGYIEFDFNGKDPFEEIGMQFQDADSNSSLTPKQMITFICKMYGDKVNKEQLDEMIKIYGIDEFYKRRIKKLSGGQKQRVNLLLATMHNPKFMILDEFITGLDILSVQGILKYIEKLKSMNNSTLVIISHQPEEIKSLADRVAILKDGVIAKIMTKAEIEKAYKGDYTKFLVENI